MQLVRKVVENKRENNKEIKEGRTKQKEKKTKYIIPSYLVINLLHMLIHKSLTFI